jgi:hypothetical protein
MDFDQTWNIALLLFVHYHSISIHVNSFLSQVFINFKYIFSYIFPNIYPRKKDPFALNDN